MLLGYRVVVYHGIHVAGGDEESQTRFSELSDGSVILPIRLRNKSNLISTRLQESCDDGRAKTWVIHVSIAAYIDEVHLVPSAVFHFFFIYR